MQHSVERLNGKIHPTVQISQVRQLYAQSLVHGGKVKDSVSLDPTLVQCGAGAGKPAIAGRPPESVIRPVHGDFWREKEESRFVISRFARRKQYSDISKFR